MAQGSRVQAHPSLSSLPTQNLSIYLLAPDFNSAINQQNKRMSKRKRKGQEGDKGLGILWSYRFTDKRTVMKGWENAEAQDGEGCRDYGSTCMYAPLHVSLQISQFVSKTRDSLCLKNGIANVLQEDVHGWTSHLSESVHKRPSLQLV